jgi:hypothetical protein
VEDDWHHHPIRPPGKSTAAKLLVCQSHHQLQPIATQRGIITKDDLGTNQPALIALASA